jgi:hypothetical protein
MYLIKNPLIFRLGHLSFYQAYLTLTCYNNLFHQVDPLLFNLLLVLLFEYHSQYGIRVHERFINLMFHFSELDPVGGEGIIIHFSF